jgi:hypothetical protein
MTIMELLVCIGVIAVLMTLVVGLLARGRASSHKVRCLSNIRGAGLLVLSDSAAHGDRLPYGGDEEHDVVVNEDVLFRMGGDRWFSGNAWTALFPDEWRGAYWNAAYRCPRQPNSKSDATDVMLGPTWYALSAAIALDPKSLWAGASQRDVVHRQNNLADIAFASKKVLLSESRAFCEDSPGIDFWIAVGQTPLHPSSTLFVDGSVRRTIRQDGLVGVGGAMPYELTIDGVRGRDVP